MQTSAGVAETISTVAEGAKTLPLWKAIAVSLVGAILADTPREMTPDERRQAENEAARSISQRTQDLLGRRTKVAVEASSGPGTAPVPMVEPGKPDPIAAPGERGQAGKVITDPSTGQPMAAPGEGGTPKEAPGADRGHAEYVAGEGSIGGYHGTTATRILGIMDKGGLVPARGQVFIGDSPESTFVHGVDRSRGAAFSIRVEVSVPEGAAVERISTPGVPLTTVIRSQEKVPAQVTELHVRRPDGQGGFTLEVVKGPKAIRDYLTR